MNTKKIVGLMACDPRGVIGNEGALPWVYPEELDHFRKTTFGQIMVMGNKTFESIPSIILKDRFNVVFSRNSRKGLNYGDNVIFVSSLNDFLALKNLPVDKEMFMIGGAEIAKLFLNANLLSAFILTKIHNSYKGDTIFPLDLLQDWPCQIIRENKNFTVDLLRKL
ncbi:MAG: dihydrofolate reductase [Candidatus Paracaedibacter sp.]